MRLFLVEIRRAFRRRATRMTALFLLVCCVIVMVAGILKVGNTPPIKYVHQSDGVVTFTARDLKGTVQVVGNRVHVTRIFTAASPHIPRIKGVPMETYTVHINSGDAVGIEGKPGHQVFFTNQPDSSLARFSDLYHRNGNDSTLAPAIALFTLFMMLLGATLAGADWKWNTYAVLLTWVPQRLRLIASRLGACFVVGVVGVIAFSIIYAIFTIPIVLIHGSFAGMTSSWWSSILELELRAGILAGIASVLGASVAILVRNTMGALIALVAYLLVIEHLILALIPRWWPLAIGRCLPILYDWRNESVTPKVFLHIGGALTATAIWTALLVIAAVMSFIKRDVTAT